MKNMATSKLFLDISLLPANLMKLQDDDFYDFVSHMLGSTEAELLRVQQINNVNSLSMTDNAFEMMHVASKELDNIKNKVAFKKEDGSFVIKAGVKANIEYLIELLTARNYADKRSQSSKIIPISAPPTTPIIIQPSTLSCSNATSDKLSASVAQWTLAEHEKYIIDSIERWCRDNEENLHLNDFSLTEGQQYRLTVKNDSNGTFRASIDCDCRRLFPLTKCRGKFQMSNYYRHLKAVKSCKVMKEIKNSNIVSINIQSSSINSPSTPAIICPSLPSSSIPSPSGNHKNTRSNARISSVNSGTTRARKRANLTQLDSASSSTKKRRKY